MSTKAFRRAAFAKLGAGVLGLALLSGGCAGDTSMSVSPDDVFDNYDDDGDGSLGPAEWDQFHLNLDSNGDGAVSRDEFNAGVGGGARGR